MCDAIREPPTPGTELFTYMHLDADEGDEIDLPLGDWILRARILKARSSRFYEGKKATTLLVLFGGAQSEEGER